MIDTSRTFGIIGLSFGGILAVELNKIIKPSLTILISSVRYSSQLPQRFILLGKTGVVSLVPERLIKPPTLLLNFIFSAQNKKTLKRIVDDTDPKFVRWAVQRIVQWDSDYKIENCVRIHGEKDRLIPLKGEAIEVKDGGHFMIVDKAEEISAIVNELILSNLKSNDAK